LECGREAAALPLAHGPHESTAESGSFAAAVQSFALPNPPITTRYVGGRLAVPFFGGPVARRVGQALPLRRNERTCKVQCRTAQMCFVMCPVNLTSRYRRIGVAEP